jgi:hypothetical protein
MPSWIFRGHESVNAGRVPDTPAVGEIWPCITTRLWCYLQNTEGLAIVVT